MRQSDAITALLARTDRSKGSSAAQLSARATGFREIQFAKGELVFARRSGRASVLDCDWPGACRVVTDDGRELSFRHTAGDWPISCAVE
jgi:hypothetical protein